MPHSGLASLIPQASGAVCNMLHSSRGPLQAPIRSEIFGLQRFAQHGRSLGLTHNAAKTTARAASFFPRLRNNIETLREAYGYIGLQASTGYDISPAAEWLLDNFHLIEAQLKEIRDGLPRSYFRMLPMLQDEPLAGLPRVYGIAWAFVAHTDGAFDEDLLSQFLIAYQETRELNLSEIWALPTTLRVVLIENLRRLAERVAANKAAREMANLCCDKINTYSLHALETLLAHMNQRGVGQVFLAQMGQRLQDRNAHAHTGNAVDYLGWLNRALPNLAAVQTQQPVDQAADNLSVSNAVKSLRAISDADWPELVARTSTLMRDMLGSPGFAAEDISTRDQTLHGIEKLARQSGRSEVAVAQALLALMRASTATTTVGTANPGKPQPQSDMAALWLEGAGRAALVQALGLSRRFSRPWRGTLHALALPAFLAAILVGTSTLVWWLLPLTPANGGSISVNNSLWLTWLAAVLMLFPASEAVVAVINRVISESVRPRHLPRLALGQGIPIEHRVMVVVPAMLTRLTSAPEQAHRLLLHYLANPEPHAQFTMLTDWADADTEKLPGDDALLASAVSAVQALNARFPLAPGLAPRFIVLHRQRHFSETEQRWIGWERKRGKLELLITALAEGTQAGFIELGMESKIATATRYVVTLDSDTQLPPGRLRELVGVAAHPQNQPQLDATGRQVISGYGILQPRIVTPLPDARDFTGFHWLFAGHCGIDPYSAATSEVYQDVFGEGTFTGKGLLHVAAVHAVLCNRLPEGQILSHDLLEGSLARCAAVTDITVIEDSPTHADVATSRMHRWTRGDWQLLPILLRPGLYPMPLINRWKMLDNLRRSLVAPMSLALILLALAGYGVSPWTAVALVLAAFSAGPLMGAVAGFSPSRDDMARRNFYRQASLDLIRVLCAGLWHLSQLHQQAIQSVDAISRALYRMAVSHRGLLQWTTAEAAQAQVQAAAGSGLRAAVLRHWSLPVGAACALLVLLLWPTPSPRWAVALCLLWALAPITIAWVSRKSCVPGGIRLAATDVVYLEGIARDTWRWFERCVVSQDRSLPPDNLQVLPHDMVAHRTSPTNIGLYLLSAVCARQFGWIGTQDLLARLEATLASVAQLQRHRGHLFNWYDTQTGAPLLPMYVSTVDSGNLCGHLLAVAQACRLLALAPHDQRAGGRAIQAAYNRFFPLLTQRSHLDSSQRSELRWRLADHRATRKSARLDELAHLSHDPSGACAKQRLLSLAQTCEGIAAETDFSFLYHAKRHLLHIGYRVQEQQLDASFYDLLASESRLTSLFAIAKGDVPVRHWAALGRPLCDIGGKTALRSWSGSMFEYLMPSLVLDEPPGSLLDSACRTAISEQIAFATPQGVPWGISESAYAASDHTLAYQYAPQGIPHLALRRTPPNELVIAPYSTALAAQFEPQSAVNNFEALQHMAARQRYGFMEALDFSPARQVGNLAFTPVATFMAHHQGMTVVALANVLMDGVVRRWGMGNAQMEAVASLLHERAPRELSRLTFDEPQTAQPPFQRRRALRLLRELAPGELTPEPTHMLSNGRYSVTLRANGAGWSRWAQVGINRWRDDALQDRYGSFFYLRRQALATPVSVTQHPAPDGAARYKSTFHADRVCFEATWPDLQVNTTVWVSPEDDIEFRQVEVLNLSDQALNFELMSSFEVTLADPRADEAHPAFSNLFVRAQWSAEQQALIFERKPRLAGEPGLFAAHFLTGSDACRQGSVVGLEIQTDRQHWLGRNHTHSQPLALLQALPGVQQSRTLDTGLDPVCVLVARLHIPALGSASLTFATAASNHAPTLQAVIDKYQQPSHVQRSSLMSATLAGIRLHALRISAETFMAVQTVTTALVFSLTHAQARVARLEGAAPETSDRRLLWRLGISGDRPLLVVTVSSAQGLGLLRALSQALQLWTWGGVACDLVVINTEPMSYLMVLQQELLALRDRHRAEGANSPTAATTAWHVLRAEELSADELSTLNVLARVHFNADGRPLLHHVTEWSDLHQRSAQQRQAQSRVSLLPTSGVRLALPASQGEFDTLSGDFTFKAGASARPLRPWINVLANPAFGAHISEAGGGYTWATNSRMNQLTAWSNDAVGDPPSEWIVLQDRKTLKAWSVAPNAWGAAQVDYQVVHGQGFTRISHSRGDLDVTATWCVDRSSAVKHIHLHLVNRGPRTQRLRAVGMVEWLLGANRIDKRSLYTSLHQEDIDGRNNAALHPKPGPAQRLTALLCTQADRAAGFGNGTAFFATLTDADDSSPARRGHWTCDRREWFDATGQVMLPDQFAQAQGGGLDACAVLSDTFMLAAGESVDRLFLMGYAPSPEAAAQLARQATSKPAMERLSEVTENWNSLLSATTVKTPDPLFDVMVNRWLLYQTVSCRLWAKAGFYQAGGATGFRDQLQDAMALTWAAPDLLRQQITLCASRQFTPGDVQHWWHDPTGAGVRTHFSDDLLWLPHATLHYLATTGDSSLLDVDVKFIDGPAIATGAEDAYYVPTVTDQQATVYEHAARAIDKSLRVGVHGLPLMGTGDWNDGMNRVGFEGRGESVWLGWFLCQVVAGFAPLARSRGDESRATQWESAARGWKQALLGTAWDGQWFKRAFFDNGEPLGSSANSEARIDLIAQAWAVLSGVAPAALQRMAMDAAEKHLMDPHAGLIKLLDPPLMNAVPSAGYIQAYPPGVRENGGQYSHAGVWALMAQAQFASTLHRAVGGAPESLDLPYRSFTWLSPAHRAAHPVRGAVYRIEPYVMAGDVYSQPPYVGQGGWSWYTGAAAWLHRAAVESIFGLQMGPMVLSFNPCLPSHWPKAEITLTRDGRTLRFIFTRGDPQAALQSAAPWPTQLLQIGDPLRWQAQPNNACFVVPLTQQR